MYVGRPVVEARHNRLRVAHPEGAADCTVTAADRLVVVVTAAAVGAILLMLAVPLDLAAVDATAVEEGPAAAAVFQIVAGLVGVTDPGSANLSQQVVAAEVMVAPEADCSAH